MALNVLKPDVVVVFLAHNYTNLGQTRVRLMFYNFLCQRWTNSHLPDVLLNNNFYSLMHVHACPQAVSMHAFVSFSNLWWLTALFDMQANRIIFTSLIVEFSTIVPFFGDFCCFSWHSCQEIQIFRKLNMASNEELSSKLYRY